MKWGKIRGMLEILRMWFMVKYVYMRQSHLAYLNTPRGFDPEWEERIIRWGYRSAQVVRAMEQEEKVTIDKDTIKRFFTEFYFSDY